MWRNDGDGDEDVDNDRDGDSEDDNFLQSPCLYGVAVPGHFVFFFFELQPYSFIYRFAFAIVSSAFCLHNILFQGILSLDVRSIIYWIISLPATQK